MNLFQRIVLSIKVVVLLTLSASSAWASNPLTLPGVGASTTGVAGPTVHAIYKSDSEPGDQGQGGSSGDDDQVDGDSGTNGEDSTDGDGKTDPEDDDSVDDGKSSEGQY